MSITDSTTTLDTAWTEQSHVEFTVGVLSTEADCVDEVESRLERGTLSSTSKPTDTQVKRWLVRAKQELSEIRGYSFNRRYAQAIINASEYRKALPPDYNGGLLVVKDTTYDAPLNVVGPDFFDKKYPDLSAEPQDQPEIATVKNMELWVAPPANTAITIQIEYERSGAPTTASDFSWLPEIERFRCCDFATAMAFESLHQFDVADRYLGRWQQDIAKSVRADGRRKWHRRISAINVFQEYALMGNQRSRTR